tara:strand:+ start:16798 stop:17436 length:639 start_codon:yes stop_codon:yes gene_type:complete
MSNEIELMVSVRRQGEKGVKRRGDIITCRVAGGNWGSQELKVHQVVTWPGNNASIIELQSAALIMAILNKKKEWGEPNPTVDFPFCEVVTEPIEDDNGVQISSPNEQPMTQTAMTNRSVLHFDFDALPESETDDVFDPEVEANFLPADDLTIYIEERGIDKREPSERGRKEHRDINTPNPILHADTALRRDQTTDIQEFLSRQVEPLDSWST